LDGEFEEVGVRLGTDLDEGGPGMLGRVGERLGDHVVRRDLDRLVEPVRDLQLESDCRRCAPGERTKRGSEAAFREDGGVKATGELSELVENVRETGAYAGELFS
jgi:hypothetical protein